MTAERLGIPLQANIWSFFCLAGFNAEVCRGCEGAGWGRGKECIEYMHRKGVSIYQGNLEKSFLHYRNEARKWIIHQRAGGKSLSRHDTHSFLIFLDARVV